jgi:hypothetical protein
LAGGVPAFTGDRFDMTFRGFAPWAAEYFSFFNQATAGLVSAFMEFFRHRFPFAELDADWAATGK